METKETKKYVLDANCFIEPWNKFYSYKFFPSYWDKFICKSCNDGIFYLQEEIYDEILKKDDELADWVKGNKIEKFETDLNITQKVKDINDEFPNLTKEAKKRSMADPFVIAFALLNGATVVTLEDLGTDSKPKIPFVCKQLNVPCINLYTCISEMGIDFHVK